MPKKSRRSINMIEKKVLAYEIRSMMTDEEFLKIDKELELYKIYSHRI